METVVRPWRAEDRCAVLALNAELQDHERALRPSLRPGAAITGAYVAALEARLARLGEDGALLVAEAADGAVLGLATCFVATDELEQEQRLVRIEDLVVTGTPPSLPPPARTPRGKSYCREGVRNWHA